MRRIGLETRVLGLFGMLVAALLVTTLALVHVHFAAEVRSEVHERLETANRVFDELLSTRAEGLIKAATLAAELPVLLEAVRTWNPDDVSLAFREINRQIGSIVVILTDRMGVILARSDRRWEPGETFDQTTSVARALRGQRASSLWSQEGRLYQMVSVPVRLPTGLAGTLSLGFGIGTELVRELSRLLGNDVVFLAGPKIDATSRPLEAEEIPAIEALVARIDSVGPVFGRIDLDGSLPAMVAGPFIGPAGEPIGGYAILRSVDQDLAELRDLERTITMGAFVTLAVVLTIGFLLARSVTHPLTSLAGAARDLAAGNYASELPRPSGSREVEDLTRSFERMREALRQRIGELDDLNAELERKVRQRTAELEGALAENRRLLDDLAEWSHSLERKVEDRTLEVAEAQRMLVRQDRMAAVGRLAAGVAHEINNPLAAISGFTEGLRDRANHPSLSANPAFEDFPEYLLWISREVDRLKGIVQKFLNFARTREPQKDRVALADVARHVAGFLAAHAKQRETDLVQDLRTEEAIVEADPEQLKQILLNLVLNGLDAAGTGGRVEIVTDRRGGIAELRVRDDGPGVPEDLREKIFEPFFSTKPPESGTGLGLALCADLVRANGGEIDLAPSKGRRGSEFVVRFPVAKMGALRESA